MRTVMRVMGSLPMAVTLLISIGVVLAWGTLYEVRFGTAAVQHFIYQSWWFQTLLGFLGLNLAVVALRRTPWTRRHIPFLLAHVGIILLLSGGIISGRMGVEGQLVIREGQTERTLRMPHRVLTVHQPNPGTRQVIPTHFETRAWVREPALTVPITLDEHAAQLTVDRYYPNAVVEEQISGEGDTLNPAVHVRIGEGPRQDTVWLFARDPERFAVGWGKGHLLFLEPETEAQAVQLAVPPSAGPNPRGIVAIRFTGEEQLHEIPVPEVLGRTLPIDGTPYRIIFKDYFPDFVIGPEGPASQSLQPNNPAVAFTLDGPEGLDPYLVFALHPEFQALHGFGHTIDAEVRYRHDSHGRLLPPNTIALVRSPSGRLSAVLTGPSDERQVFDSVEPGASYRHPWLDVPFTVATYYPRAVVAQEISNRGDEVRAEAVHVVVRDGDRTADGWVGLEQAVELFDAQDPLIIEYRQARRELPVAIKLIDFRKIDYPGTQMASGFESDVQLIDTERGVILLRMISMNNPLKYHGYSFFQSSFIPGQVETTVLSVRKDPGTPLVYTGCTLMVVGIIGLFVGRSDWATRRRRRQRGT